TGVRALKSNHGKTVAILWRGGSTPPRGKHRPQASWQARRHRSCSDVLRFRPGWLDHRPGAERGRRKIGMDSEPKGPLDYVRVNRRAILDDLIAFASIPSVSTDPAYSAHIAEGAAFVAERMRRAGLENIRINPTEGHPVVTADWLHAKGTPTILVYGHYDVQPPDPLDKWKSPPFKPEVRDNRLYARGVSDDKGPMLIPLKTAEAYLKTTGRLPINLKLVIEGEEERGSAHLGGFVAAHAKELAADFVLSADGAMWRPDE